LTAFIDFAFGRPATDKPIVVNVAFKKLTLLRVAMADFNS
jgi:hypothetical protein